MVGNLEEEAKILMQQIESLQKTLNPSTAKIFDNRKVEFNLKNQDELETFRSLKYLKLSEMTRISINYIEEDEATFNKFMKDSFPDKCKLFSLNNKTGLFSDKITNISSFLNGLI